MTWGSSEWWGWPGGWWEDNHVVHGWERWDNIVLVCALPAASTWGSISFRAPVQSPPTLHPHPRLHFGGRKTEQHVNRE